MLKPMEVVKLELPAILLIFLYLLGESLKLELPFYNIGLDVWLLSNYFVVKGARKTSSGTVLHYKYNYNPKST